MLLASGTALAAGPGAPPRVLLVPPGPGDPVVARLLDELVAAGIAVEIVPAPKGDPGALAGLWDADAVLRVEPGARAVSVWVVPTEPGEVPEQRVESTPGPGDHAADLALRSVEVLRGRLLRVERVRRAREPAAPPPPPPPPKPAAPVAAPPAPIARPAAPARAPSPAHESGTPPPAGTRVSLYAAPAILASPGGGASSSAATWLGVRVLSGRFGVDAFALASLVPGVLDAPAGRVTLSATTLGLGGWYDALSPASAWALGAGLGLAGSFLSYDARPSSPSLVRRSGVVGFALPYGRAALAWRAFGHLALRLDGLAGVAAPRPVVQAGPAAEVAFGRPVLAVGLGVELTLP